MFEGKTVLGYTNLFSPNHYKKNDKIVYKYFKDKYISSQFQSRVKEKMLNIYTVSQMFSLNMYRLNL